MADFSDEDYTETEEEYSEAGVRLLIFLMGAVVGVVALGVVWMALSPDPREGRSGVSTQVSDGASAPADISGRVSEETNPTSALQDPAAIRLDRCGEVFAAQRRPLDAVDPAMSQWEIHIGAMNKLVVGAISLRQAWQFWNQTRVAARENLQKFAASQRGFDQRTSRCPRTPDGGTVPAELRSCTESVAARNRALQAADRALQTWRVHVGHMEMLRRGEMSPQDATRLWLQSWQQGNREVRAYHAAARAAETTEGDGDRHHHGPVGQPGACVG